MKRIFLLALFTSFLTVTFLQISCTKLVIESPTAPLPKFKVVGKWISDDSETPGENRTWWLQLDSTNGRGWLVIKMVSEDVYNTSPIAWLPILTPPCNTEIVGMSIQQGGNTAYPPTSQFWYFMTRPIGDTTVQLNYVYVSDSVYHTRNIGSTYCY